MVWVKTTTFLTLVDRVKNVVKDRRLVLWIHPQLFAKNSSFSLWGKTVVSHSTNSLRLQR
jgi:hypothetical protein